ncbi:hypothetical protein LEP1GSC198_1259 [Leptospira kirschneri str. JB]|nr:hypothetical protein LEP1GSC198_1259 [Leptospira kirschneri str. JB]
MSVLYDLKEESNFSDVGTLTNTKKPLLLRKPIHLIISSSSHIFFENKRISFKKIVVEFSFPETTLS